MGTTDLAPQASRTSQRASVTLRFRSKAKLSFRVAVTSGGIVAVGVLVSGILLSTAVLVRVAKR